MPKTAKSLATRLRAADTAAQKAAEEPDEVAEEPNEMVDGADEGSDPDEADADADAAPARRQRQPSAGKADKQSPPAPAEPLDLPTPRSQRSASPSPSDAHSTRSKSGGTRGGTVPDDLVRSSLTDIVREARSVTEYVHSYRMPPRLSERDRRELALLAMMLDVDARGGPVAQRYDAVRVLAGRRLFGILLAAEDQSWHARAQFVLPAERPLAALFHRASVLARQAGVTTPKRAAPAAADPANAARAAPKKVSQPRQKQGSAAATADG